MGNCPTLAFNGAKAIALIHDKAAVVVISVDVAGTVEHVVYGREGVAGMNPIALARAIADMAVPPARLLAHAMYCEDARRVVYEEQLNALHDRVMELERERAAPQQPTADNREPGTEAREGRQGIADQAAPDS